MKKSKIAICIVWAGLLWNTLKAQQVMTVKVDQPGAAIQPTMWGVFFEDINLGADGGLYAELVKNRSFEFTKPMMGWKVLGKPATEGDLLVLHRQGNTANPRFLRITLHHAGDSIGLSNEGFRGMGIKEGEAYDFSLMYAQSAAHMVMHIGLVDEAGRSIGAAVLATDSTGGQWRKGAVRMTALATVAKARLNIWWEGEGVIDIDMVSLFPVNTWKQRPGGMRADMVQMLADMKPGFIRFPGGCVVEGYDLSQRYQWKKTIGPVEERQLIINRWNFEFPHRSTPDYFQSFGLGFFEYFQLAEDIGAEPLPILNCGMACQFNSAEVAPLDELGPYVQDALDLIEFANGDIHTQWGKVRADMGHPEPFHLKMMGVGNENWGPQYIERLGIFTRAIKGKYPDIQLINSAGTDPSGDRFDYLNGELRGMHADLIDEHYYRRPEWFFDNARRYDNYPRGGSRVFCGEYAAQSDKTVSPDNKNCWMAALAEAAFMTGLERNADVVSMASYAPLFAHAEGWQWTPDLIWVDNLRSYGTPDYYVQRLYSLNKGTRVVPITLGNAVIAGQDSLYATACLDDRSGELIIKLVNASGKRVSSKLILEGLKKALPQKEGVLTVLKSDVLYGVNSFDHPQNIVPKESAIKVGKAVELELAAWSFNVIRVKMGRP
jgi:alpha-L-arabinofuranosidase